MKNIPLEYSEYQYSFPIELENRQVTISINYATRNDSFYIGFEDGDNGKLTGIKIVPFLPLLSQNKDLLNFNGDLVYLPLAGTPNNTEIDLDTFATKYGLFYLNADEVILFEDAYGR